MISKILRMPFPNSPSKIIINENVLKSHSKRYNQNSNHKSDLYYESQHNSKGNIEFDHSTKTVTLLKEIKGANSITTESRDKTLEKYKRSIRQISQISKFFDLEMQMIIGSILKIVLRQQ